MNPFQPFFTFSHLSRYSILLLLVFGVLSCSTSEKAAKEEHRTEEPEKEATRPGQIIDEESVLALLGKQRDDSIRSQIPRDTSRTNGDVDVDSLLSNLTLREKIGQLIFPRAYGRFVSQDSETYHELMQKVKEYKVGGIMFSAGDIYGQAVLTNKLQEMSDIPLWISQDMEYGAAMRVSGTTRLTPAMGIAATQNPDYAYWAGKITAREAKALGVHQIYAPVLDVNNNPDNPIINVRSFSANPQTVSEFGNAFIEGASSEDVVATAKHFPGHGDTNVDSHLSLPVIDFSYERLDSLELAPFKSAIDNGIASIMSAHIAFPQISDSPETPGTLDPSILNRILVDSLRFDGVIVTDGLEMSGISSHYSPGEAVVKALQAGSDLMLLSPDEMTAIDEVEHAVQAGDLSEERIDRSVRKLLYWKKQHGLFKDARVNIDSLDQKISTREHKIIADEIARRSVTVLKNDGPILPIRASKFPRILAVSVADDESGDTGSYFAGRLQEYHPSVEFRVFDKRTSKEEKKEILQEAERADLVLIGSFIFVRSHRPIQYTDEQIDFLDELIRKSERSGLISFGNPYVVQDLPDTDLHVMGWSANRDQVRNAVPALFGASEINGKMPISIPEMYVRGYGLEIPHTTVRKDRPGVVGLSTDSLRAIDHKMQASVRDSTFPGGVVAVVKNGVVAYQKAFGYHTYDKLRPVRITDIYDLASLTKIVATTTSVMKLIDRDKLSLYDKVSDFIPEFKNGGKADITIQNLLVHNSGLPAFRVYVDTIQERDELIEAIKNEPLEYEPGTDYVYSDLGFILLAEIVSQIEKVPFDQYVRQTFYEPLGMNSTYFNPSGAGAWIKDRIPPTEIDSIYRKQTVHGVAHDERAFYMDGVAGHAGLFSNSDDIAVYAQMLLNKGAYAGIEHISPETVDLFTYFQSEKGDRALGFSRKSKDFSTGGTLTSELAFGHTGFTGTSLWIDPERNIAIIILTNRTYPYRSYGRNISRVRSDIADMVIRAIIEE